MDVRSKYCSSCCFIVLLPVCTDSQVLLITKQTKYSLSYFSQFQLQYRCTCLKSKIYYINGLATEIRDAEEIVIESLLPLEEMKRMY